VKKETEEKEVEEVGILLSSLFQKNKELILTSLMGCLPPSRGNTRLCGQLQHARAN